MGGALFVEMDFARTFPEKYHATTMVTTEFAPLSGFTVYSWSNG